MSAIDAIAEAAFPLAWCRQWGLPCDPMSSECCGSREVIMVVSLVHVADALESESETAGA